MMNDAVANAILHLDSVRHWGALRELIVIAEDADFTEEQNQLLAPRLLALAAMYRDGENDGFAVGAAIRTGASMLRPEQARQLLLFLKPGRSIGVSIIAVKMLGRIFEAQPPQHGGQYAELASDVRRYADSFLGHAFDPDATESQRLALSELAEDTIDVMNGRPLRSGRKGVT